MGIQTNAFLSLLAMTAIGCQLESGSKSLDEARTAKAVPQAPAVKVSDQLPLDIWPASTRMMFGLNMAEIRESPLGAVFSAGLRSSQVGLVHATSDCRDGLLDDIDSMLVFEGKEKQSVVVIRGIERLEVDKCTPVMAATATKKYGPNYGAWGDDLELGLIWWMDSRTMILSPSGGKSAIDAARPDKERAPTNPKLLQSISRTDTSASIWVASVRTGADWSESFDELRGSIDLSHGLKTDINVQFTTPEGATEAVSEFQKMTKLFSPFDKYLEESKATADGQWLKFTIAMSHSRLGEFARESFITNMFPARPADEAVALD